MRRSEDLNDAAFLQPDGANLPGNVRWRQEGRWIKDQIILFRRNAMQVPNPPSVFEGWVDEDIGTPGLFLC